MKSDCICHPGRSADATVGGRGYCTECREAQHAVLRSALGQAVPRGCAARHLGRGRWGGLSAGGSAHWLAHELGVREPAPGLGCLEGFAVRMEDVLRGRLRLGPGMGLRRGDVYVSLDGTRCGLVASVRPDEARGLEILIRHPSSHGDRVVTSEFYEGFKGIGGFFR